MYLSVLKVQGSNPAAAHTEPAPVPSHAHSPAQVASSFLVRKKHKVFCPGGAENHTRFPVREQWHLILNYSGQKCTFTKLASVFNTSDFLGFSPSLSISSLPKEEWQLEK